MGKCHSHTRPAADLAALACVQVAQLQKEGAAMRAKLEELGVRM
jgi:hypothetical protein